MLLNKIEKDYANNYGIIKKKCNEDIKLKKNIIFDLGGVLVDFHPKKGMEKIGFSEEEVEVFMKQIFSGLWEYCDQYPLEDGEIRALFKEHVPGYEKQVDMLWDNLTNVTGVRPYANEWLAKLKESGYRLYVLSNYGKNSFEINSKTYDFLKYFDGMVISYEEVLLKPDPKIYNRVLEKFDLQASECVFIDDRKENVDGAIACGIDAIVFTSYEDASAKLDEVLGAKED